MVADYLPTCSQSPARCYFTASHSTSHQPPATRKPAASVSIVYRLF
ncbi:hypothetical protein E2C01_085290 [Portunus trituberculatus]|uniref:Uncharacterized protein n=1 Tax=Portunus trituberculatus TaxID=210409 RepID=A0A5B7J776_PORTR|nr:hypothetical protein [Portunus trituberculatus]